MAAAACMRHGHIFRQTPAKHGPAHVRLSGNNQRQAVLPLFDITPLKRSVVTHAGACCGALMSGAATAAACFLLVQPASACDLEASNIPIIAAGSQTRLQQNQHSHHSLLAHLPPSTAPPVACSVPQQQQRAQQLQLTPTSLITPSAAAAAKTVAKPSTIAGPHTAHQHDIAAAVISSDSIWYPLLLSTVAGLSTSIGGLIAISLSPGDATLAFLLGTAIGVMCSVSVVELWVHTAAELSDPLGVTAAVAAGAALFVGLDQLLPQGQGGGGAAAGGGTAAGSGNQERCGGSSDRRQYREMTSSNSTDMTATAGGHRGLNHHHHGCEQQQQQLQGTEASERLALTTTSSSSKQRMQESSCVATEQHTNQQHLGHHHHHHQQQQQQQQQHMTSPPKAGSSSSSSSDGSWIRSHPSDLWRLGLLMTVTMTLHNLPEGFAVAFSAYTDIGPIMTLAIALHNIPEGLVIAAPVYAASGNRWQALGLATASGLSEPLGAAVALFVAKPFVTNIQQVDYLLAATGGVMIAVCIVELYPEGRKCDQDDHLVAGVLLGAVIMAWTLYVGV